VSILTESTTEGYLQRWRRLGRAAWLYLLHAALLTGSLAITSLLFNVAILALGYPRGFLGLLNTAALAAAAALSLPLWWLAARVGLRRALLASAVCQSASALAFALWPASLPLLLASALTGVAAVLFQVSSPPFMMQHSGDASRDHLFSANAAINVGVAGLGSLLGGRLPELMGRLLGAAPESATAYRASFAVAAGGLLLSAAPLLLIANDGRPRTTDQRPGTGDERLETTDQRSETKDQRLGTEDERWTIGDDRSKTIDHRPTAFKAEGRAEDSEQHAPWLLGWLSSVLRRWSLVLPTAWRDLIRHPWPLLQLLTPPLLISIGAALLIPYLNIFFKERFALSDSELGAIFAALGVTTGAIALTGPLLSTRIGKIRTVIVTQALSIPFLLLLGFTPVLGLAVAAALLRAALFNMGAPLYDAFAMERTAAPARPAVIGLINGAYSAGYLVGPLVSTLVQERYGFAPIFVVTAICYALAMLANYLFFWAPARNTH
jgi:MFS family permease